VIGKMTTKEMMKAIICTKYGGPEVLKIQEMEKPIPASNEVLIKVKATSVTLYDSWSRSGTAPPGFKLLMRLVTGIRKPKQAILGTELAGEIESVGEDVSLFKKGDQVYAYRGMNLGAYVEYICLPEDGVVALKPSNMSFEEAASVQQGALTALYFLRNANIQKRQKILVFGASGGVGSFAVQLAKYFDAEVTGVCSTAKIEFVKSLGADKIIDYKNEDFTKGGEIYDIIFDTVGKTSIGRTKKVLKDNGFYLFATFGIPKLIQIVWLQKRSNKRVFMGTLEETTEDLIFLRELIEAGKLKVFIDNSFPLEQAAEAHRYLDSGQKKGQVVITMESS
jgi:NADPH:quinone reductase-like Zn-dependent oxidoreductase